MNEPTTDPDGHLRKAVTVQRILVGGLIAGAVGFAALAIGLHFLIFNGRGMKPDLLAGVGFPVFAAAAGVVACGAAAASFVMAGTIRTATVRQVATARPQPSAADRDALAVGWQGGSLVRAGLCEGPIVLSLVLFLMCGDYALLAIAAAMLGLLVSNFPGEESARRWVDAAEAELEAKRAGG